MNILKKAILSVVLILCYSNLALAADIAGNVKARGVKGPAGAVVYIKNIDGDFKPAEENPRIDQVSLVFTPRVLPIVVGSTVEFHNSDTVLHNVFGVGDEEFDLGTWKGEKIDTRTFNNLGEVAILCNVHPEMEAYIVVLENPYFGMTDEKGHYIIKDVPPGSYTLKTWHDRLRSQTQEITVGSETITVDFKLKR